MKERHGAPKEIRSTNCSPAVTSNLPQGLVGPTSVVPVLIEGVYAKALLDSGSQVTILYRSFYNTYLKHLAVQPVENLEIWGLSSHKYPYDGYLPIRLEFTESVAGVPQTVDTLALVCPDPVKDESIALLVGTNTSLVRQLFDSCKQEAGDRFMSTLHIHPLIRDAYQSLANTDVSLEETEKHGTVWFMQHRPLTLQPGKQLHVTGIAKFPGEFNDKLALVEQPKESSDGKLQVRPEVHPASVVYNKRITVTLKNTSAEEIVLKRGTPLAHVFPVAMVPQVATRAEKESPNALTVSSFDFGNSPMPEDARNRLCHKMLERKDVFSCHEWDVGCSKNTKHDIRLTDTRPFRERSRRLPLADLEDVRKHLQELQANGIISESRSPYASPIVVVRKKTGKVRMCVDYRTLNQRTIPDQYTVPRVEDALHSLSGSKWFSVLDLRSGYYQIPMSEADKEKTAFICPLGFYQFERMPQGISGAPATFQRVMERTIGDMNFLEVLVYLDDLIVFGKTIEEHEERLLKVLDRLKEEGLKLSLDKCQFGRTSVTYVGHIVSKDGIATDPSKIEAVVSWPRPKTVTELRSFLGFCGYYRRFVRDFSKLCRPLNELLQGYPPSYRAKNVKAGQPDSHKSFFKPSEPFGARWSERCESVFQELKTRLTQAPVLAFADPQRSYVLHVDASTDGLGGVLYQQYEEGLRPVAFISRSLSPSEKNYPAHKLEFLALKWAVVDRLHDYLYGVEFEVRTDNNPLTYILTSAKLDATGHRWLSALSTYNFSLKYRPGRNNIDADSLSRRPHPSLSDAGEWHEIPVPGVRALCQSASTEKGASDLSYPCVIQQIGAHVSALPKAFCQTAAVVTDQLPKFSPSELLAAQKNDPCMREVLFAVQQRRTADSIQLDHPDLRLFKREWDKLSVEQELLYRTLKLSDGRIRKQLVLPKQFHSFVLNSLHDQTGHLGCDKTYALVRDRFFWPRMKVDVESHCKTCERCIKRKTLPQKAAPLSHMHSSGPLDLVCIDFLSIEPDSRNVCNVLVVTDHFTRYAQAFPTRDQKAITVAKTLWERYFIHYGLPARIHSDQGRDFESQLVKEMLTMLGVKKSRTSPYHPQGDPQPERFNRTLLDMLGTLDPSQKQKWSQHVAHLVHSYNCTPNEATGFSPYFLMFGREARLPVDVCFGVSSDGTSTASHTKYVSKMKKELHAAYQLAQSNADKMNQGNKDRYDQKVRYHCLNPEDRVLIRNLGLKGKQKLADRWSANPYLVDSQMSDLPVYRLRPVDGNGPIKVMHRNHILPLGQDVRLNAGDIPKPACSPRAMRRRKAKEKSKTSAQVVDLASDEPQREWCSSDSDSEFGCYFEDVNMIEIEKQTAQELVSLERDEPNMESGVDLSVVETEPVADLSVILSEHTDVPRESESPVDLPAVSDVEVNHTEPVEDTERVQNDVSPEVTNVGLESPCVLRRSERDRKPAERFTYDTLGEPTKEVVTAPKSSSVHSVYVGSILFPDRYNSSHVWWCTSQALCNICVSLPKLLPCT